MTSRQARNLMHQLTNSEREHLKEQIELKRTAAIFTGKKPDIALLRFTQAELNGEHPKAIEPIRRGPTRYFNL